MPRLALYMALLLLAYNCSPNQFVTASVSPKLHLIISLFCERRQMKGRKIVFADESGQPLTQVKCRSCIFQLKNLFVYRWQSLWLLVTQSFNCFIRFPTLLKGDNDIALTHYYAFHGFALFCALFNLAYACPCVWWMILQNTYVEQLHYSSSSYTSTDMPKGCCAVS